MARASLAVLAASTLALAGCELLVRPDDVPPPKPPCEPQTCEDRGKDCGSLDDGCGNSLGCGECTAPEVCGGGGVDNVCATCAPRCQGRECGPDGCGGKCGSCAQGEYCDPQPGQCVGCRSDADCAANPAGTRCEPARKVCVACLSDADCDASGLVACDPASHLCAASCKSDADCKLVSGAPRCDASTKKCVGCLGEADCSAPSPHCLATTRTCVACRDGADCGASRPLCRDHLECVECLSDAQCPGGRCQPASSACVDCLADVDCGGATPKCSVDSRCVECASGSDCASLTCNPDGTCVPPGVAGETCAHPITLDVVSGSATAMGDTTDFVDDTQTYDCGGGGPDVVYKVVLSSPQDVDVLVWPEVATYRPTVAVRKACADETEPNELGCAKSRASGEPATVSLKNLGAGTYHVLVDGYYTSKGAYSLTVLLRAPGGTLPDSCQKARALSFDANGWAWAAGDTTGLTDDLASARCGAGSAPDLAYQLTLTRARSLDALVTATGSSSLYAPLLYLTDGCTLPVELACDESTVGPGSARIQSPRLQAGTYVLWVDGNDGTSGPFALWVGLSDPLADTCAEATDDLAFDASGKAHVEGSTANAANDASSPTCYGTGGEVFYRLTVGGNATVTAKVTPNSAAYDPVVYLRSVCDTKSSEVGCVHGAGQTLTATGLSAGSYWLVVDGYLGTSGEFALDVTRTP